MEAFLEQRDGDFYEKEEPWYRWSYRAETVDERHSGKGYGYGHKRMDSVCSCLGKLENGMQ